MPGKTETIVQTGKSKTMTTQLTFIDDYFTGSLSAGEKTDFEKKLQSDPAFADEVGFYLSSMAVSRESGGQEKKQRFKALYTIKGDETTARVIKFQWLRPAMAAAALLLIAFMAWTFFL